MKGYWLHLVQEFQLPLENPVLVFSLILFIILLSPILLRKLNIPAIIGLIISGVIIGPYGLNLLEKTSAIQLFSTIGLLYIMFIAGLELDMNEFKLNRNKSLLFGFFTFIIPLGFGFPICYHFLGYGFNASLLTASMFATHTLVAYPIVSRLGISQNKAVAVAVGGTILTDTAVLVLLAIIMSNAEGSLNTEFWIRLLLSLAVFTFIMFSIIPKIAKWFFSRLESEKQSQYIFVLSVVFFAAFLAEVAGVEPIIGAFMAGLSLNRLIPRSSALMNRIEFIGNALFIPFFLISVGMLVDLRLVLSGPGALIVAGTLTAVAIFGKWMAAFITQKVYGYSIAERQLIFGLSSAHAAATLAVILVGYEAGILDDNILNGTILLILITCIVASFSTENAGKAILKEMEKPELKNDSEAVYSDHILIPIANLENIEKQLEFAITLRDKSSEGQLSILTVVSNDAEAEANIRKARQQLEKFVKEASATETKVELLATIDHNAASGIARVAKEVFADLIVLGWPVQTGLIDKLIGQKVDSILSNSDRTLFITHIDRSMLLLHRIVVIVPPLAEWEMGFPIWVVKLTKLSSELSKPMLVYCNSETAAALEKIRGSSKQLFSIAPFDLEEWDDLSELNVNIRPDDLLVLVSARKNSASYLNILDNLPGKLEKNFASNSRIIIYPYQKQSQGNLNYTGISHDTLERGIGTFQKIGKGIGNILRSDDEQERSQ